MPGPLQGYRIVDLTSMVSGPSATMLLADQGADVIKVENPQGGDHTRAAANRRGGFSASFLNNNRNKRSIVLDLKAPSGIEALKGLIATADVFIQNFRSGVIERMGFGEAAVRALRPDIVYVSISGFGEAGPFAQKPVYDPLIQALSGLASIQGGSDQARPRLVRTIVPDKLTGVVAAQAITAALLARERTGEGQHVRLSMLDAVVAFLWGSDMGSQTFVGDELPQQEAASFIDLIYETADDYISAAVQTDREWTAPDAGAGPARVAGRSALRHAGVAAQAHRRAADDDAGGAAHASGGRVAATADRGRRAVCAGADAEPDDQSSAGGGEWRGDRDRASRRRSSAPGATRGPLFCDAHQRAPWCTRAW